MTLTLFIIQLLMKHYYYYNHMCVLCISLYIHLARLPQDDTKLLQIQRREELVSRQKIYRFDETVTVLNNADLF